MATYLSSKQLYYCYYSCRRRTVVQNTTSYRYSALIAVRLYGNLRRNVFNFGTENDKFFSALKGMGHLTFFYVIKIGLRWNAQ